MKEETSEREIVELEDNRKLGIATLGALRQHPRITAFRRFIEGWYLSYFTPDAARGLPLSGPQKRLNTHGDNISNYVQFMERDHPKQFQNILEDIAQKLPGISKVSTDRTINNHVVLKFSDKAFKDPFLAQQMSDGTLKVFAYLLLMSDPNPPPLLCIKEPENGLYHKLLEPLAHQFRAYVSNPKTNSQIFITTHQPYFVNALDPDEVWILEKGDDGFSTIHRASSIPVIQDLVSDMEPDTNILEMPAQTFDQVMQGTPVIAPVYNVGRQIGSAIPTASTSTDIFDWLATLYCIGIGIFTIANIVKYAFFHHGLRRDNHVVQCGRKIELYRSIAAELHVKRLPRLMQGSHVTAPFLAGIWKPTLYLPMTDMSDTKFGFVVRHELIHYRHADLLVKMALLVLSTLHWFNPFTHMLRYEYAQICEKHCDEVVVQSLPETNRMHYASTLLQFATMRLPHAVAGMTTAKTKIKERITHVIRPKKSVWYQTAVIVTVCAVLMSTSMLVACGMFGSPDIIAGLFDDTNGIVSISAGATHSLIISEDGSLWTCGDNTYGQLGNGKFEKEESIGAPISILDDVVTASAGGTHSMAIRKDDSLWAWGGNSYGQIGNGPSAKRNEPIPVKIMDDVVIVSAGYCHTMAIRKDGSLWAWGNNDYSQLGIGTQGSFESTPVKVMDDVVAVSAGYRHTMAIKKTAVCGRGAVMRTASLAMGHLEKMNPVAFLLESWMMQSL